jgi:nucleotide-binding universal stress UspA family protein
MRSNLALPYAISIAGKYGSKIFAAHVVDHPLPIITSQLDTAQIPPTQAEQEAEVGLASLETRWFGIPHEILLRKGDIWTELSEIINTKGIGLIVIGTHGRTGNKKLLMGSIAEKIYRQALCPVLTVGPAVSGGSDSIVDLRQILCPTDFSAESLAALPYAISLARENKAHLHLLHIAIGFPEPEQAAIVKSKIRKLVPSNANLFAEPKVLVEYGAPAQRILELAEEFGTDLIVLGVKRIPTHFEQSKQYRMATAYKVVSQAICPVLTVRG